MGSARLCEAIELDQYCALINAALISPGRVATGEEAQVFGPTDVMHLRSQNEANWIAESIHADGDRGVDDQVGPESLKETGPKS